jgi:hypothetical protein
MMPPMRMHRLTIVVIALTVSAIGAENLFAKPGRYTDQLEAECNAMVQSAVKRPYGWAWDPLTSNADPSKPRAVLMQPQGSPAVGMILQITGEMLKKPAFLDAAEQAARGALASRDDGGCIAPIPIFADSVSVRADSSPLPDRSATRAALGLALTVIPNANAKDELTAAASSAAKWLARQQSASGAWPTLPGDAGNQSESLRVARLDNTDARDSTFAMRLAAVVLNDKSFALSASRSTSALLQMRRPDHHNLWMIAYDEKLSPLAAKLQLPADADLLASQYAMQTLLAEYVTTGERRLGIALDESLRAAASLRRADGGWDRFPSSTPASERSPKPDALASASIRLSDLIDTVRQLKVLGRDKYTRMIERHFTVNQQLSLAICGLEDSPLMMDLPVTTDESLDYIRRHQAEWKSLDDAPPAELPARVHRLWLLLIRAKLEQM